jgi:hypothetical protein
MVGYLPHGMRHATYRNPMHAFRYSTTSVQFTEIFGRVY